MQEKTKESDLKIAKKQTNDKLSVWEIVCFIFVVAFFIFGAMLSIYDRKNEQSKNLTLDNYHKFIEINTSLQPPTEYSGVQETYCWVEVHAKSAFIISDIKLEIQLQADNCTFEQSYVLWFDELRGRESFAEKLSLKIDMTALGEGVTAIYNASKLSVGYTIVAIEGEATYEK